MVVAAFGMKIDEACSRLFQCDKVAVGDLMTRP